MKIKGHIQSLYQHLGEITYGGMKNGEDVSEETAEIVGQLDEAFARIEELFEEITAIKNGTFVPDDEMDWEEEYAEEYDEEISEEEAEEETEEEIPAEEPAAEEKTEFDINID